MICNFYSDFEILFNKNLAQSRKFPACLRILFLDNHPISSQYIALAQNQFRQ
jgi:hypothetical protein